ncbi:hypothetical protein V6N12_061829 [Hibiscus sabdariffa]|uniref:tRNA pseudouridine synthase n=1 Tax=Hibiscus sabdariffa TaxID=183260 RepID=A0ABR2DY78_9ROSI
MSNVTSESGSDVVGSLIPQLQALQNRVKKLEAENAKLSSQLSKCCCHKGVESQRKNTGGDETRKKKATERNPGYNLTIMSHHPKRYVALKVMYFGQSLHSSQIGSPTVMILCFTLLLGQHSFDNGFMVLLQKHKWIPLLRKESQYSRCGRTDKGVSSVGQVIALFLRSNLKETDANNRISGELIPEMQIEGEIDYVRVLNRVLPSDIRILGWSPVSIDFSARFSCLSREYKYFFWRGNLNLPAMENAGKKFIGEHDFRNFCKMDAANVHNYKRRVTQFEISSSSMRFEGDQLCAIKVKGSAFLWHQVRCMVAVLFMIGQGLESVDLIDELLDIEKTPRKPQYAMAPEIPLILQSCEFEDVKFICSSDSGKALLIHLENEGRAYQLQSAIFQEAALSCLPLANEQSLLNDGTIKKVASHIPLLSRPTEPSYEERRSKLDSRR